MARKRTKRRMVNKWRKHNHLPRRRNRQILPALSSLKEEVAIPVAAPLPKEKPVVNEEVVEPTAPKPKEQKPKASRKKFELKVPKKAVMTPRNKKASV